MFKIYGGQTKFKQWTKNQKLVMSKLPLGAEVLFYNNPSEDEPLVTEVYEFESDTGTKLHVCNVPNIFLTEANKIKVRIPNRVIGLYGIVHSITGPHEKYFEVEPAEKPDDYVYEETPTEGGSCQGSVSDEQIEKAVKSYFSNSENYVPNEEVIALLSDT